MDEKLQRASTEVLIKEYDNAVQEIRLLMGRNEKIMGLGLTILGAGFALGIRDKISELVVVLPLGAFGILLYVLFIYTGILALGGYKRRLEERINNSLGGDILVWEIVARKVTHHTVSAIALYFILLVLLILSVWFSLRSARHYYGLDVMWGFALLYGLLFVALAVSMVRMAGAFDRAYQVTGEATVRKG